MLEAIASSGVYRSQFETGTSNGGLTAHPGGDRWRWESAMFGTRYDDAAATGAHQPAVHELPFDDPLNDNVEAHVHGGLRIARNVEAVVVDPSDLPVLEQSLARLGCAVEAHPGYRVTADQIDIAYRGPDPVTLAQELGGTLTPDRLAIAARSGEHAPQTVKWLWHWLTRFGRRW